MKEYCGIGNSPSDEDCVQVKSGADYRNEMRDECRRFRDLLTKAFPPPDGARFRVKWSDHDFGEYAEVGVEFDDADKDACEFAYSVENNVPKTWWELEAMAAKQKGYAETGCQS